MAALCLSHTQDKNMNTHAKSVFSMTNFTFSSVNSVIFTVGWLAYGIVGAWYT